jgi:hypothetical protein
MEERVGLDIGGRSLSQAKGHLRKSFERVQTLGHRIQSSEQGISILYYGGGSLELQQRRIRVSRR